MQNDPKDTLARLSEELLAQEELPAFPEQIDGSQDALPFFPEEIDEPQDEPLVLPNIPPQAPAFDDPQAINEPEEPIIYRNFSNGYGRDLPKKEEAPTLSKSDKIDIGLMLTACGLCLGIIGVLIYWLTAYLA